MSTIQDAILFTLDIEKGFWNDPVGGPTMYGVTQKTYDAYRAKEGLHLQSVRLIEDGEVRAIMEDEYWYPGHCNEMPAKLAIAHFDTFYNSDPEDAVKILQRALGGLEVDGKYGEHTAAAIANISNVDVVIAAYLDAREQFYRYLATQKQAWADDLQGWLNRLTKLKTYLQGISS